MVDDAGLDPTAVPAAVLAVAAGRATTLVWANEVGGLTYALGDASLPDVYVKWNPHGNGIDLTPEIERLRWADTHVTVPRVVRRGADADGAWFVTAALAGTNAVTDRWTAEPAIAVPALGRGLRHLHDTLPVDGCPFTWSVDDRLVNVRRRLTAEHGDPSRWSHEHRHLTVDEAVARLAAPPPIDRPVVCHGDACSPNTLLTDDGEVAGHVDLGNLGVADRWADLAVATWSTNWNYGPGWEEALLDAYGVASDPERIAYYRLLWDLDD